MAFVASDGWIDADGVQIAVESGDISPGPAVLWSIRPERVLLVSSGGLPGTVMDVADVGTAVDLFISLASQLEIQARAVGQFDLEVGAECHVELPTEAITVWPEVPGIPGTHDFSDAR